MSDAITRKEAYLKSIGDGTSSALKPITREEQYLAYIAGESKSFPTTPITREEAFLDKIAKSGVSGGSSINVQPLNATANGTYDAPEGQAYDPVIVDVKGGIEGDFYEEGVVKFVIYIPEGRKNCPVRLSYRQNSWWKCLIDWGDGSEIQSQDYDGNGQSLSHNYGKSGYFVIKMIVPDEANGSRLQLGVTGSFLTVQIHQSYAPAELIKLYAGYANTVLYQSSFANQYNLTTVIMHDNTIIQYDYTFQNCVTLMETITIPTAVTTIGTATFEGCSTLSKVVFPKGITKIKEYAFSRCFYALEYDFTQLEAVPTLAASSGFQNINSGCKILVPAALYDEWIAATNWATYASNIVAV